MQVSGAVGRAPGVSAALVAMATPLNVELAAGMGLPAPEGAGPNDLLVALRGEDEAALDGAEQVLEQALAGLSAPASAGWGAPPPPRTTAAAAARAADAGLALVSVPGPSACAEALDALRAGLSVMVFSDNVPVEQEVLLKDEAARRDLLVMGPDCGTAVVAGVGLGFANAVRPGPVGLVAASGTGAQQVMALLDASGVGVSHCLGLGGRDLSAAVGGRSARQALRALDADPATELVVLVSKPPAPEVAEEVAALAASLGTPVQLALLGPDRDDLTAAARAAVEAVGGTWSAPERWDPAGHDDAGLRRAPVLRGLFAGGTLCDEAMAVAARALGPVRSNIPLDPAWALPDDLATAGAGHAMLDLGDDRMTQGRAHPMIDQRTRLDRLAQEADDPDVGVLLLDVVLGHGAHPDPASELAPALGAAVARAAGQGRRLDVVVSLCGTDADPQGLRQQAAALAGAGAQVHRSNAAAARAAVALATAPATAPATASPEVPA
ncbi:FdrA family protein [Vallicoccus soli]|uniref:FdrA family protein n=2 Tax=Vallicoccus soli TaxID=2339232 RepID=A0A3A3ZLN3_9ACTN|nr:FdrA family protein [Vallicoccus soli]